MKTNMILELRRISQQMAVLAERLDNMTIGVQPITKRDAAIELESLRVRVQRLVSDLDNTDIEGR